ncbi:MULTISPECIES: glycosyltransferase family A protein [unclassified Lactococcus]|uniref:glycosyltransferase family A protein n=1 Tax=Lactococcus TaxID=1357 RepID=UPI0014312944|nr:MULTISPECIES: glycosyltransferase family A protein [unclassified Lactococcus]KAF6610651.1 glycosyltransferase family 2 protein [Lactococcus sp. EKM201L]KAF6613360.1 glycosyltransferase family 2 protein [Lactococcus sp. EKM203L]KAF6643996.1 glycosyltransferase family 2 protein [Lactococcus sp. EKM501L]KAF6647936.1 glycosyltransferase family 2 protein [Lactococcus sp. EKM502L]KAF6653489.1 glycosyltransferase family 2 protein [Lactococcus sp. EKM101L]
MSSLDIIVPFYNDAKGIHKLLISLEQFSGYTTIIIIDDNSDYNQYQELINISKEYNNVKVLKNDSGCKGAGSCRNLGILESKSPWMMFADSDDHFLNNSSSIVEYYLSKNYDMVYFPPISSDENGNIGHRHDTYLGYFKDSSGKELRYKLPVVWSRLFNSDFIKSNRISFENTIVSNDRMFSLVAGVYAKTIKIEDKSIYSWDFNSSSLTTKMSKDRFKVNLSVFERVNKYLNNNLSEVDYKKYSETGLKFLAMSLFRYKYGVIFTIRILNSFLQKKIPIISRKDLKRFKTFFRNNKYYSE